MLKQGVRLLSPFESGTVPPACPQSAYAACSCAAIAAATSQQGNKAVLTHMSSQAQTNHRPQRLAERGDIRRTGRLTG